LRIKATEFSCIIIIIIIITNCVVLYFVYKLSK
jgi:hypothetical protein